MRVRSLIVVVALISVGCDRTGMHTGGDDQMDHCIKMMRNGDVGSANWSLEASRLCQETELITNVDVRVVAFQAMANKVLSVPLDGLDYGRMDLFLSFVPGFIGQVRDSLRRAQHDVVDIYELNLSLIDWHMKQLKILRPKRMFACGEKRHLDERWWRWQRCYERVFVSLRSCIDALESDFYVDAKKMSDVQREKIKRDIERRIGRPMRTEVETKDVLKWESEEYKAVKLMMVAP